MKSILITGASTGIGRDAVRALHAKGHQVIVTIRNEVDAKKLQADFPERVIPIILDVAKFDQISELPKKLKYQYQIENLDGLINNAGVALAGPFLDQDFHEIENIMRVNVLSVMKLTQVLLPLLGASSNSTHSGKIINISSIAGRGGSPFLSAYAASKHAIEGFSDALRKELMIFGIQVVVIGPGSIKTPIWDKGFKVVQSRYEKSIFAKPFQKFIAIAMSESNRALEVSEVSNIIVKIFETKNPRFRYAPIPRPLTNWYIPMLLPKRLYNYLTANVLGLKKDFHS